MSTPRRSVAPLLLVAVFAVACTSGGDGDGTPTTPGSSTSPPPSGPVRFQPGEYRYVFGGITADLGFDASTATLEVKNASGTALDAPSLYVIDATGARYDGRVDAASAIPDGDSATFQVSFPDEVRPRTIGLVILSFGDSNYGAFAPLPAA